MTIRLLKPYLRFKAGERVVVTPALARYLIDRKVAERDCVDEERETR